MRVLVADDSSSSRALLTNLLSSWGYEVTQCTDGQRAWSLLSRSDAPQLAILDWMMPGLDGLEVCRRLRAAETERHAYVFLVTARSHGDEMLEGLEAGADDYLVKPFEPAQLRVRLRHGERVVQLQRALIDAREALRDQASRDPLTGLMNRRAFDDAAAKELSRAQRAESPMALLMIDLDHFKRVNDTLGHPAGDSVLVETAARLRAVVRESDHVARFGGEEMVVLLPDCAPRDALLVAERVRRAIARAPIGTRAGAVRVTASVGVAVSPQGREGLPSLIARADAALYRAKNTGRDRAVLAPAALPIAPERVA